MVSGFECLPYVALTEPKQCHGAEMYFQDSGTAYLYASFYNIKASEQLEEKFIQVGS